ncbi:diguanylate cyclase [Colwellia sp. 6_MG-2023]|uniref:GGDEF domain-containing protein n=1 Tax=Colwellia sp. 6_MG-2023 TaxID=3062676 RepID=UPI0026E400FD|nr:diguanylate cyclase [Colwellia sp. 6_MG-2023]MDO6488646.1 diguanylate cyclase [Colwellia sp. 6_MG-2023]
MNTKTVAVNESKVLQKKLNAAIASRASLEEDFKAQSSMLIEFINKLSQVSKGVDIKLDNRLAQLRILLTKSAPVSDIELKINEISTLLQQQTTTNKKNISQLHTQFNSAGQSLQKVQGLPSDLRRKLRTLLQESQSTKESITQYAPLVSKLLAFYSIALQSKSSVSSSNTAKELTQDISATTNATPAINSVLIGKISSCLSKLQLSTQYSKELLEINKNLLKDTTHDDVLLRFIEIFDVIFADLQHERNSAKHFLNTLSETLTTVQHAVKETLSTCKTAQDTNLKINQKLQGQLLDMAGSVKTALSLEQVKVDINGKIINIAKTLEKKTKLELQNQEELASQLSKMVKKVEAFEEKSKEYESKLAEQKRKSMQDALTKLSNRAAFDEYFTQAMVAFHHKPFNLALAVIDIDDFKSINDNYGHTAGDKTLQVIANTIQKKADKDAFIARYGGEEFVLIYKNHKEDELVKELNFLNKNVSILPFKFKDNKVSITLSIGATHISQEDNIHTAFERADEAMYKAKTQGKNQVIYA